LAVDNIETKKPLLQSDINILMGIANQIGISIYNAKLIEARFRQFQSILQVLAATTDARDPITAGHSEKVTEYAVGICHELGLSYNYTEMIRVASLLHDYGKIGVDDAILKKPGRLTSKEYDHIKTHAFKSKNILEQVNFEGIYTEVPEIAGSHHEKLDGTGYPNGLIGDQIHFGAKIIAVADVFEALTSKRHYRDPMMVSEAFEILVENIGTHFDKQCVEALINFYNKNFTDSPYSPTGNFAILNNV
jgi:HD-GYP domain-containing protein (c-di-GMP phosphodiesterase class II)